MLLRNLAAMGVAAIGLSVLAIPAQADPLPNLTNLNFLSFTGPGSPKNCFSGGFGCHAPGPVNPTGWTGGNGLIFIDQPGDASNPNSACGGTYLQTYGCPSTLAIKGGYNYVEADGNPIFASGFNYAVSGLTPGKTYTLSFYQAASQQTGFVGDTTEQWIVSLGTAGLTTCIGCGPFDPTFSSNQSTYSSADPTASIAATNLMHTPSGGMVDWRFVSVNLTADATTDLLSFLAWGDDGTTNNLPPIVFLTGVNSPAGLGHVPEPASLALFGAGVAGFGARMLRKRAKRNA